MRCAEQGEAVRRGAALTVPAGCRPPRGEHAHRQQTLQQPLTDPLRNHQELASRSGGWRRCRLSGNGVSHRSCRVPCELHSGWPGRQVGRSWDARCSPPGGRSAWPLR